ncbi:hypothetical protein L7F22_030456 [Adiantum nelumboides]|nr:hypothetical protein [Adiantum nelumboides]
MVPQWSMLKRMRSQEQLWLQNHLFSSASGPTSSKHTHLQAMAMKRLLTYHKSSQAHRQDHNVFVYLHMQEAGRGYGESVPQEAQLRLRGQRNVESSVIDPKLMRYQLQNCLIGEAGSQGRYQVDLHKLGPEYGVLQAHQQVSSSTRGSGLGTYHPHVDTYVQGQLRCNESQGQLYMKAPGNSDLKTIQQQEKLQQHPEVIVQHQQKVGNERPPGNGVAKIAQQQEKMQQCPEVIVQNQQKVGNERPPGNGIAKIVQQQEKMQQCPEVSVNQRPLPKRLLPIPVNRRNLCTTTGPPTFRKPISIADSIKLTNLEFKIFNIFKGFLVHYNLKTELRVAGGWVRDKLLGKQSGDIDIALDNMLGRIFCQKLLSYCRTIGMEPSGFGVIKCKPNQARHLEVAKMEILGVSVDFVHLRPPDYAEINSKSSSLQDFGTIVEDAHRRDLTINSLFYNINTGMVEDPTGRGLSDLRAGIIATPSAAKDTFRDDPLRALRALRFVSVLGYELHPDAKDAIDWDIKVALAVKISRERIGAEVERIFRCNHPLKAMELLVETKLFPVIFSPPSVLNITLPEGIERTCLHTLGATIDVLCHFGSSKLSGEHRKSLYLAAFLSPLRTHVYKHKSSLVVLLFSICLIRQKFCHECE